MTSTSGGSTIDYERLDPTPAASEQVSSDMDDGEQESRDNDDQESRDNDEQESRDDEKQETRDDEEQELASDKDRFAEIENWIRTIVSQVGEDSAVEDGSSTEWETEVDANNKVDTDDEAELEDGTEAGESVEEKFVKKKAVPVLEDPTTKPNATNGHGPFR